VSLSSHSRFRIVAGGLAAAATIALTASPAAAAAPKHREIKTVSISLGRVLAASNNHVLYLFERDTKNHSNCDATCRIYWPPVKSKGAAVAGAHVRAAHLGRTSKGQVTYYGHPLYFFASDSGPKQANGEGQNLSGGEWYVVGTNGKAIEDE
jgi:predicted lipoprotein with Yx(FWY)xxD motif